MLQEIKEAMMLRITKYLGITGFFVCLIIMYATNHGIRDIRQYDMDFKMLDMQFHYSATTVYDTFEKIGVNGRKAYRNFWILDFIFIICFLIVQITISNSIAMKSVFRNSLIALSLFRMIFDILENCLLVYLIDKFPTQNNMLATICSYITTSKFIVYYTWIVGVGAALLYPLVKRH